MECEGCFLRKITKFILVSGALFSKGTFLQPASRTLKAIYF